MSPQTLTRAEPTVTRSESSSIGARVAEVAESKDNESQKIESVTTESVTVEARETKLSEQELELWLRFQFNTASYIDPSYKSILFAPKVIGGAKGNASGNASGGAKGSAKGNASGNASGSATRGEPPPADFLGHLWGDASLSRHISEFFSLDFSTFPGSRSELPFFVRLAMIDAEDLQQLLFSMGLVLSSGELALFIDRAAVANLREQLGERDYLFASGRALALRPSADWISLQLDEVTRGRLSERDFQLEIGLRLLLLHCKADNRFADNRFDEQILRRLALKCPYSVVSRIERSAEEGLAFGLAVFANADEAQAASETDGISAGVTSDSSSRAERLWLGLSSEVIERWHAWLAY